MNLPTRLRASWQEQAATLADTLHNWPWLDTLRTLRQRFREDRLGQAAGSLTFTTLIALVPLVTVMLALFSAFPMFASFQDALQKYFLQSLVPDNIAKPVLQALTQFASKSNRLGSVGFAVLVVTAVALMLTIDRALNAIWRVRQSRPIAQRVLVYWAAATLGPLLLGISLSFTSYAVSASRGLAETLPGGISLLLNVVEFVAFAAAMTGLYRYVPNTHVRWRHALAGGVFVSLGFEIAKKALAWYLGQVPTYSVVYGAFATVPIFLVWIYVAWVIVLLGAVIAAYAPSLRMRVVRWPDTPGSRFHLGVALLRELARLRASPRHGADVAELAAALRVDPLQVEPILATLVTIDWIGLLDEGDHARYVLLVDPQVTKARPAIELLLIGPAPALRAFWQRAALDEISLQELVA